MRSCNGTFFALIVLGIVLAVASGCESGDTREVALAPVSALPPMVRSSPPVVQEAYRFALANPQIVSMVPCYCGCGGVGHTSNYSCYVQDIGAQGEIHFDNHALG